MLEQVEHVQTVKQKYGGKWINDRLYKHSQKFVKASVLKKLQTSANLLDYSSNDKAKFLQEQGILYDEDEEKWHPYTRVGDYDYQQHDEVFKRMAVLGLYFETLQSLTEEEKSKCLQLVDNADWRKKKKQVSQIQYNVKLVPLDIIALRVVYAGN